MNRKANLKSFFETYKLLIVGIIIFLIIKSFQIWRYPFLLWDETVYISMGKYLFSNGTLGFIEIIRPLILPLYIGLIWKAGIQNPLLFKIAIIPITLITTILVYKIAKKLYNHNTGIISALIFLGTGTILFYSSSVLTGLLATMFMLLSLDAYINKYYMRTGVFAGLSFLTRFPFGLYIAVLGIFIFIKLIQVKPEHKKEIFISGVNIALAIILITIPFFLFNYISYRHEVSQVSDAIFRPLLYGTNDVSIKSGFSFETISYYIKESFLFQPLLLFGVIGLLVSIPSIWKKQNLLLYGIVASFGLFFMYYNIKDIRFTIPLLPILSIYSADFLSKLIAYIRQTTNKLIHNKNQITSTKIHKKRTLLITYSIVFLALLSNIAWVVSPIHDPTPYNLFTFIKEKNIEGPILSSDPQLGAYIDVPISVSYFKYNPWAFTNYLLSDSYQYILVSTQIFICDTNDCKAMLPDVLDKMNNEYHIIYSQSIGNEVFSLLESNNENPKTNVTETRNLMNNIASLNNLNITFS